MLIPKNRLEYVRFIAHTTMIREAKPEDYTNTEFLAHCWIKAVEAFLENEGYEVIKKREGLDE